MKGTQEPPSSAPVGWGPAYRVETQRLVLRCWQPSDAPPLRAAIEKSLEHLRPWMPWARDEPRPIDDTVRLLRRFRGQLDLDQDIIYGLFDHSETTVLGGAGLHPTGEEGVRHIGYWVHVDHVGRGLATEAAAALTKIAFELHDLRRVEVTCDRENVRSAAVPRKLGYNLDATLRERVLPGIDTPRDTLLWSLLAREYPTSLSARTPVDAYDARGVRILRSPG